jgi:DNA (cytosine-5)-methyltransferase 1
VRVLDLFCGAGGASAGYVLAGHTVVGVDINPQRHYPFEFHQADALTFPLEGFDFVHASPPCQRYSSATPSAYRALWPDLVAPIRDRLESSGLPYVIENVPGAPLRVDVMLCGVMFGKPIARHRIFESNVALWAPHHREHPSGLVTITGGGPCNLPARPGIGGRRCKPTADEARTIMEMPWATKAEMNEAIPPAYTMWIGMQL